MSEVGITCRCGFVAEFARFCVDAQGRELPRDQYRCPACGERWRRKAAGEWTRGPGGEPRPERIEIEIIGGAG